MRRREITAAVVAEVERCLAEGWPPTAVAARSGVTPYVVGLIAAFQDCPPPPATSAEPTTRRGCRHDAATVRGIRRMLAVGILNHVEIAREAGVSPNFVAAVAQGKRPPISKVHPPLRSGERFLEEPVRCHDCRALLAIAPCRACLARREKSGLAL